MRETVKVCFLGLSTFFQYLVNIIIIIRIYNNIHGFYMDSDTSATASFILKYRTSGCCISHTVKLPELV